MAGYLHSGMYGYVCLCWMFFSASTTVADGVRKRLYERPQTPTYALQHAGEGKKNGNWCLRSKAQWLASGWGERYHGQYADGVLLIRIVFLCRNQRMPWRISHGRPRLTRLDKGALLLEHAVCRANSSLLLRVLPLTKIASRYLMPRHAFALAVWSAGRSDFCLVPIILPGVHVSQIQYLFVLM